MVKCRYCEKKYNMSKDRHACIKCENKFEVLEQTDELRVSILWSKRLLLTKCFPKASWIKRRQYNKLYTFGELVERYSVICEVQRFYHMGGQ